MTISSGYWLRKAVDGRDLLHNGFVADMSQNPDLGGDYYKKPGIFGCLTPGGHPAVLHRGRMMLGYEKLLNNGIPVDQLLVGQVQLFLYGVQ